MLPWMAKQKRTIIRVRPLMIQDITRIEQLSMERKYRINTENAVFRVTNGTILGFVAFLDNQLSGALFYTHTNGASLIHHVIVDRRARTQGIGTALVNAVKMDTVARRKQATVVECPIESYKMAEWWCRQHFLPVLVVENIIEFHWIVDDGARIVERLSLGINEVMRDGTITG